MPFNTSGMFRGYVKAGSKAVVLIFRVRQVAQGSGLRAQSAEHGAWAWSMGHKAQGTGRRAWSMGHGHGFAK
jgi:hypothetical protein